MSEDRGSSLGNLLVAFLAGAAVGAAVVLLTSPKSGAEMRETLADFGKELGQKLKDAVGTSSGDAEDAPLGGA